MVFLNDYQTFLANDEDTLRYLYSAVFQGLAALFALTVSAMFVVTQLIGGSYSYRAVKYVVRKSWLLSYVFLFGVAMLSNFILLSFVKKGIFEYVPQSIFVANNLISIAAIVFLVPVIFRFITSVDPMEVGREFVKRLDKKFFETVENDHEAAFENETPLLVQVAVIKAIESGDTDFAARLLGSLGQQIKKNLTTENYLGVFRLFSPVLRRVISVAADKRDSSILRHLVGILEGFQREIPVNVYADEDGSFTDLIFEIMEEATRYEGDTAFDKASGALSRLARIIIPQVPMDENIASIRTTKYLREHGEEYERSEARHFRDERIFSYIERTFLGRNHIRLAKIAARNHRDNLVGELINDVAWMRHDISQLGVGREEVKRRFFSEIVFNLEELSKLVVEEEINAYFRLCHSLEEIANDLMEDESSLYLVERTTRILIGIMQKMIDEKFFLTESRNVIRELGLLSRFMLRPNHNYLRPILREIIDAFRDGIAKIEVSVREHRSVIFADLQRQLVEEILGLRRMNIRQFDPDLGTLVDQIIESLDIGLVNSIEETYRPRNQTPTP